MIEYEYKYKVPHNLDVIREKLHARGFEPHGSSQQIDSYYVIPKSAKDSRVFLRLRHNVKKESYKMCGFEILSELETKEVETSLSQEMFEKMKEMFEIAQMPIKVLVDKKRETFKKGDVCVEIDVVKDLGNFVEIEIVGEEGQAERCLKEIVALADFLDLHEKDRIIDMGYVGLVLGIEGI